MSSKNILITGVAGSGKTTISAELEQQRYTAFDIENYDELFVMKDKETKQLVVENLNDDVEAMKRSEWVCNPIKLRRLMDAQTSELVFYCGVASNNNQILPFFDLVLVLVADANDIRNRLSSRKSGQFGNTIEMQDWVLSYKSWLEENLIDQGAIKINASRPTDQVVADILQLAQNLSIPQTNT